MASKLSSRKGNRKESVEEFAGHLPLYTERLLAWITGHLKVIGIVAAVVVIGIVIGITWFNYQKDKIQQALVLEAEALDLHKTVQSERISSSSSSENEDTTNTGNPYQEVIEKYQEVIAKYSGSESAGRAVYMMGSIEYELGNYEKAWEHFSSYSQKYPKGPLSIEAEKSLGYILEQQGKHQEAIEKFKSLKDKISSTRKAEIQLAIARNYEVLQNVDEAVTTYQVIVDSNTTFSWKDKARERLAILRPEKVTPSAETPEGTPVAEEQQEGETKEVQPAGEETTTETSEESPEEQPAPETTEEPAAEQPSGNE